ncbi:uracil phosphoribosyltransferase [Tenacibaculum dicentrarchi]|uniref:Uracil phosphoribosyltransferase n=2 Tax=Tenacibaculum TaxID=104267 RepID=A0A2I2LCZ7_9FLAO|nr:uracil phosphoribosyltransferase [Tenacibaculum finnmarkense]ALU73842.1 uracil phosphoribosyltransferase [Tenacibaculum dicentrarchi]MBE7633594.1 uracil phosphoribosyltransferase [Tenacibaculum finnmarkense genomovar ulcerans]MBE7645238.1 uracil phosphoribosyltransferase [Tenacibaculum finnmarkense genomovar ulcerans]MBE7647387.1 uracil phosphoribosyltransferase [Tenacibaculum finnmarkense genomovar ulcerans]MBE7687163.1 uracil phosphoribosyltransferase [Tenacibaculum finnmarkense genomovar
MHIDHLAKETSILNKFLTEIRSVEIQKDSMRFRRNIERIGEILGYELSKKLATKTNQVTTPLGVKEIETPVNDIILCSILRAGLPLHNGLLNYFDDAENAFISAYRHHPNNDDEFEIVVEYFASPSIEGKTLLLVDPMLASGRSLVAVYDAIKKYGTPKEIQIVSVLGSSEGVEYISKFFPENTHLWIADIDNELDDKGYIVPGLGDAGDLAFGTKM